MATLQSQLTSYQARLSELKAARAADDEATQARYERAKQSLSEIKNPSSRERKRVSDIWRHHSNRAERFQANERRLTERITAAERALRKGTSFSDERKAISRSNSRSIIANLERDAGRGDVKAAAKLNRIQNLRLESRASVINASVRRGEGRFSYEQAVAAKKVLSDRDRRIASEVVLGTRKSGTVSARGTQQILRFQQGQQNKAAIQSRRSGIPSSRNQTPIDANISLLDGTQARAAPPVQASFGTPSQAPARAESDLSGFESRIDASNKRSEDFFGGQGFKNVKEFSRFVTFGGRNPDTERSFAGQTTENILFGVLSAPIAIGGAIPAAGERLAATGEALIYPETRENILPELGRASREVEQTSFSFLPGGTPINPEGAATIGTAALFALPVAAGRSAPPARTTGPTGPIKVEVLAEQRSAGTGSKITPPTSPRTQTTLTFDEGVKFPQSITRGKTAETSIRIDPEGALVKNTVIGRTRFETRQGPNADRAILSEFRNGKLVDTRVVRPVDISGSRIELLPAGRETGPRSTVQPKPNVLIQSQQLSRPFIVQQNTGPGGRQVIGSFSRSTSARSVSRAADSSVTPSVTGLEFSYPRGSRVLYDVVGEGRVAPTRLRVGSERQLRTQERVFSRNDLDIVGSVEFADGVGFTRQASINRGVGSLGRVDNVVEVASITRGEIFLAQRQGRISQAADRVNNQFRNLFEGREAKANARQQKDLLAELDKNIRLDLDSQPGVPRKPARSEKASDAPVNTILKNPKTSQRSRSNDFFVESLDVRSPAPRIPSNVLARSRTGILVLPASDLSLSSRSSQGNIPRVLPDGSVLPAQKVVPTPVVDVIPIQRTTPAQLLTPTLRPPQETTALTGFPGFPGNAFVGPPSGNFLPPVGALPFGGGGGGRGSRRNSRKTQFKNRFSTSIAGDFFGVESTVEEANIATITGLGVRALKISK